MGLRREAIRAPYGLQLCSPPCPGVQVSDVRSKALSLSRRASLRLGRPDEALTDQPGLIAKRAGQRSPSGKTWRLVIGKLERRRAA